MTPAPIEAGSDPLSASSFALLGRLTELTAARRAEPVVRVEGLEHSFGSGDIETKVLLDVHLSVRPGEIVIMTGPSGCGKTTLLTLIGGLRRVQHGSVRVRGQELRGLADTDLVQVRRGIGFIFQRHNLFDSLTAMQNVRMAQELRTEPRWSMDERAARLLGELGLGERLHYKPASLSGGQRQRVAIARALINDPKLILADEPTAALDEQSADLVVEQLKRRAKAGATCFVVTHDKRILDRADRIVSMEKKRIIANVLVPERLFICNALRRCVPFSNLSADDLTRFADRMSADNKPAEQQTLERHPPGSVIVRQGEAGDKFYLIRRGRVRVVVDEGTPGERAVKVLVPGGFFGEVALVMGEPRNATVRAVEEVETYTLDKEDFNQLREGGKQFVEQVRDVYLRG